MRATLRDGLVLGVIGYAAVAIFYAIFDVAAARGALFTVNMLGESLFGGAPDPSRLMFPVEPQFGNVFGYNAVHVLASLLIGFFVMWMLRQASERPSLTRLVQFVIASGYVTTIAVVGILTRTIRPVLPWWSIIAVNSIAMALAAGYLFWRRPRLVAPLLR